MSFCKKCANVLINVLGVYICPNDCANDHIKKVKSRDNIMCLIKDKEYFVKAISNGSTYKINCCGDIQHWWNISRFIDVEDK
jgi:hypothetical protein